MTKKVFNKIRKHLKEKDVKIQKIAIYKNKRGFVKIATIGSSMPIKFIENTDIIEKCIKVYKDFIIMLCDAGNDCFITVKVHRRDIRFIKMIKNNIPLHSRTTMFK